MTLLLFGGPSPLADWFGLRRSRLLFHLCCCTLRTLATETTGKLASVICLDMDVVLSPRNGYVRKAVVDQQLAFLGAHIDQLAPTCFFKIPLRPTERLILSQSVLPLTAPAKVLQNCMLIIPKMKAGRESGFMSPGNSFILNNMAERVGFEFTRKRSFNNIESTAGTVKAMEDSGKQC